MSQFQQTNNQDIELPPRLQKYIKRYDDWQKKHIEVEQDVSTVKEPLYHYTDGHGLRGILETGQIWFTDYRHLNDPSELTYGIRVAHKLANEIAAGSDDGRVKLFLELLVDMFRQENFADALDFFVACFSRARDDLGQWRAYADNGRGFAIALPPSLFTVTDRPADGLLPEFVGPVRYNGPQLVERYALPLKTAVRLFQSAVDHDRELLADKAIGIPFMQLLAREVIASPLIWNCLTSKHPAYAHEQEVRLVILGESAKLAPLISTRFRSSEIVPYIAQPKDLRSPHGISEIVVGPAAPADTERTLRTMLDSVGLTWAIDIRRSEIPYRAT